MSKMRGVFSEYERMKIKERFRMGKIRKASEGHILASMAPYGFNFIPKKGKKGEQFFQHCFYKINEIETFAQKAVIALQNLNFEAKQAIVRSIIDKAAGSQAELKVYGYIPINYVELFSIHRNCRIAQCGQINLV